MDENSGSLSDVEKSGIDKATLTPCAEDIRCDGDWVWCTRVGKEVAMNREMLLSVLRTLRDDIDKGEYSATFGNVRVERKCENKIDLVFDGNARSCVVTDKKRRDSSMDRGLIEFLELFK